MQSYYTFIALDIAQQRVREAEQQRLVNRARASDPSPERSIRRSAAGAAAALSRFTGRIAQRLDENVLVPH